MPKFRKINQGGIIEAMRLPQIDEDPTKKLIEFLHGFNCEWNIGKDGTIEIESFEGLIAADAGDWIVKREDGYFYQVKPNVFKKKYKKVN